jgi:hypothetical protein
LWGYPLSIGKNLKNGGENAKVGEHSAVVIFELEAYPEPKILSSQELKYLLKLYDSVRSLAERLGCSIGFISDQTRTKTKK